MLRQRIGAVRASDRGSVWLGGLARRLVLATNANHVRVHDRWHIHPVQPSWSQTTASGLTIELVEGDITAQRVDVIVNAANSSLLGGGGVDGAIHRRGGPQVLEDCQQLRRTRYGRGLRTGEAVATRAGDLPARWVVHTVGPVYNGDNDADRQLLRSCFRNSLAVADSLGAQTVAFPLISSGIYGWPMDDAVRQALYVFRQAKPDRVTLARLVLFGASAFQTALEQVSRDDA